MALTLHKSQLHCSGAMQWWACGSLMSTPWSYGRQSSCDCWPQTSMAGDAATDNNSKTHCFILCEKKMGESVAGLPLPQV